MSPKTQTLNPKPYPEALDPSLEPLYTLKLNFTWLEPN